MRVRGLKRVIRKICAYRQKVAPYAGAWIETIFIILKKRKPHVAPYAGAWIETLLPLGAASSRCVAPYAGAWIET